jgi:hypothetical protein
LENVTAKQNKEEITDKEITLTDVQGVAYMKKGENRQIGA